MTIILRVSFATWRNVNWQLLLLIIGNDWYELLIWDLLLLELRLVHLSLTLRRMRHELQLHLAVLLRLLE